jgi:hypothetical protein
MGEYLRTIRREVRSGPRRRFRHSRARADVNPERAVPLKMKSRAEHEPIGTSTVTTKQGENHEKGAFDSRPILCSRDDVRFPS